LRTLETIDLFFDIKSHLNLPNRIGVIDLELGLKTVKSLFEKSNQSNLLFA